MMRANTIRYHLKGALLHVVGSFAVAIELVAAASMATCMMSAFEA
ncbi:hypothetical protein [Photobacterium atrarenae]|nr:hypothetical protein [Photobacterium atrarenae]